MLAQHHPAAFFAEVGALLNDYRRPDFQVECDFRGIAEILVSFPVSFVRADLFYFNFFSQKQSHFIFIIVFIFRSSQPGQFSTNCLMIFSLISPMTLRQNSTQWRYCYKKKDSMLIDCQSQLSSQFCDIRFSFSSLVFCFILNDTYMF